LVVEQGSALRSPDRDLFIRMVSIRPARIAVPDYSTGILFGLTKTAGRFVPRPAV